MPVIFFHFAPLCFTFLFERSKRYESLASASEFLFIFCCLSVSTSNSKSALQQQQQQLQQHQPHDLPQHSKITQHNRDSGKYEFFTQKVVTRRRIHHNLFRNFVSVLPTFFVRFWHFGYEIIQVGNTVFCCIFPKLDMFLLYVMLF